MDLNKLTRRSQEALAGANVSPPTATTRSSSPSTFSTPAVTVRRRGVRRRPALGAVPTALRDRVNELLGRIPQVYGGEEGRRISPALSKVLERAFKEAEDLKDEYVSTEHLLLGLVETAGSGRLGPLLAESGITRDRVLQRWSRSEGPSGSPPPTPRARTRPSSASAAPHRAGSQGQARSVIGRDDEIRRVIQVLSRRTKNNPVLIGEPGVGKTAIVEGSPGASPTATSPRACAPSARRPRHLFDGGRLEVPGRVRGADEGGPEGDRGVRRRDHHLRRRAPHHRRRRSRRGAVDAGNMIKPMLARGELRMIGATTLDEYRKHIEKDPALERRFQPVLVNPPSVEDTIAILRGLKERYEVHHGVRIQDAGPGGRCDPLRPLRNGRFLPDKAIDLIDEAASRLRIEIDSMPMEIDVVERRIKQLEIERAALRKEKDAPSRERLARLEEELARLNEESRGLKAHWQLEKEAIDRIRGSSPGSRRSVPAPSVPSVTASWPRPPNCATAGSSSSPTGSRMPMPPWPSSSRPPRC